MLSQMIRFLFFFNQEPMFFNFCYTTQPPQKSIRLPQLLSSKQFGWSRTGCSIHSAIPNSHHQPRLQNSKALRKFTDVEEKN